LICAAPVRKLQLAGAVDLGARVNRHSLGHGSYEPLSIARSKSADFFVFRYAYDSSDVYTVISVMCLMRKMHLMGIIICLTRLLHLMHLMHKRCNVFVAYA
jgi:hypothetical protein